MSIQVSPCGKLLTIGEFSYVRVEKPSIDNPRTYWACVNNRSGNGCSARAITDVWPRDRLVVFRGPPGEYSCSYSWESSGHTCIPKRAKSAVAGIPRYHGTDDREAPSPPAGPSGIKNHSQASQVRIKDTTKYYPPKNAQDGTFSNHSTSSTPSLPRNTGDVPDHFRNISTRDRFLIYDSDEHDERSDEKILVFATKRNLEELASSEVWCIDASLEVTMPIFNHVLVIFGCSRNNRLNSTSQGTITSVPLVYALLSNANQKQYATVFQAIVTVGQHGYGIPKYAPHRIVSDLKEPVMYQACTQIFPDVKIVGCFYLLARSIRRLMQSEVFQNLESCYPESEEKNYAEMLLTLAFVPTKDVPKIFHQLKNQNLSGLGLIFDYFDEKYIGTSSVGPLARNQVTANPPFSNTSFLNHYRSFLKIEHDRADNANETSAGPSFREQTQPFSSLVQAEPPFYDLSFWNAYKAVLHREHRLNNASEEWHDRFSRLMSRQQQNLSSILNVFQEEQWLIDEIRLNTLYSEGTVDLSPSESWNSSQNRLEAIVRGYSFYDSEARLAYLRDLCDETSQLISEKEVSSAGRSNQALQNDLSIYVKNVGGMKGKMQTFLHTVLNMKTAPDVIVILESWLDDSVRDSEIYMPGFTLFRRDRDLTKTSKTTGGGIIVYVKQVITCRADSNFSGAGDILSIQFSADNRRFLLFSAYFPSLEPYGAKDYRSCFSELCGMIRKSSRKYPFSNILLCGDFNLPGYQLTSNQNEVSIQGYNKRVPIRECAEDLEICVNHFELLNCFGRPNECDNTLDMIFTSVSDAIIKLSDVPIFEKKMYHSAYDISIPCKGNKLNSS